MFFYKQKTNSILFEPIRSYCLNHALIQFVMTLSIQFNFIFNLDIQKYIHVVMFSHINLIRYSSHIIIKCP
jgi:hypothetical protein